MTKRSSLMALFASFGVGLGCAPVLAAHSHGTSGTAKQVESALQKVQDALARGDDAASVSHLLYGENAVLLGEGDVHAARGMKAAIEEVREWSESLGPGGQKTCKFKLVQPAVLSATTFSSFVLLHCDANPPKLPQAQELRMMYVWQRLPQGWRVELEMWAPGRF